ncbi:MAG TPA: hypothetical protein VNI83_04540 [Vicinamibacterales bacterium]|nr:hypothetical protein [Vicinamibacterales bacterium]
MERRSTAEHGRRRYQKPELSRVALRPEEAVLQACKNNQTTGPGQPKCNIRGGCSSMGS